MRRPPIATLPAIVGLALAAGAVVFIALEDAAGVRAGLRQRPADIALAAGLATFLVVGGVLAVRRPRHLVAWLLIAEGLVWELGLFCAGYASQALPGADVADWILGWIWVPGVAGVPLLLLLFPDGRPPSRRWWPVAWLALAGPVLLAPAIAGALASLVVRYRRAGALERRQLAWMAYAGALIVVAQAAALVVHESYLNVVPLAALPIAIGLAITRHRLYALEQLVERTLLAGVVGLVYVGAVATLGGWPALAAALVTAVLVRPRLGFGKPAAPLSVKTLGGFRVFRAGEPIAADGWQSKKARTLFKILIARRGRPVPREELMELLWPGDDPAKLGNRLSVALATLRAVLGRELEAIRADGDAVALDLTVVAVDVERFFAAVEAGDFAQADRLYGGDFLEEDRYEDWAADLRDQAREAYASALRARARLSTDDEAVRAYLRLLEHDPWDATAHQELIARLDRSGRHGEAIRRRRTYIRTMAEIGMQAAL